MRQPKIKFDFTHYEHANQVLEDKCKFLEKEVALITKMYSQKEKEFGSKIAQEIKQTFTKMTLDQTNVFTTVQQQYQTFKQSKDELEKKVSDNADAVKKIKEEVG